MTDRRYHDRVLRSGISQAKTLSLDVFDQSCMLSTVNIRINYFFLEAAQSTLSS